MYRYGIIGLGFIADKHIDAINKMGGTLVWGCDIDERKADKLPSGVDFLSEPNFKNIDCVVIATPNDTHALFIRQALEHEIEILCEKPPVIDKKDFDRLKDEDVNVVLQLRHHPEVLKLKETANHGTKRVNMKILVRRDQWYFESWKGDAKRSGGVLYNIGVHYFDVLCFIFGHPRVIKTTYLSDKDAKGHISFDHAEVSWELSLMAPMDNQKRILEIDGEKLNLSQGFENLHAVVYEEMQSDNGVKLSECETTVNLIEKIKKS